MSPLITSLLASDFIKNFPYYFNALFEVIGGIALVATTVVKLTPSKADNEWLDGVISKVLKFCAYLPTFGINPNTKKLQEAHDNLVAEKAALLAVIEEQK